VIWRREALAALVGASLPASAAEPGAAILIDIATRRVISVRGGAAAGGVLAAPGSTLKPFALAALLKRSKLRAEESFPCPGRLRIGGRSFDCTHPRTEVPMRIETALTYSCNAFVAHMAERFGPGEFAGDLEAAGFSSRSGLVTGEASGRVSPALGSDAIRLQALGESGIVVTLAELAEAYRILAVNREAAHLRPVVAGLEGAVEFGTAQRAQIPGWRVAGKTGSVRMASGERIAWFAGFAPSAAPKVVVAVMTQGRSGGADAAPIAAQMLADYRAVKR
jgi:cell division protein FtsI (penicillin-binding protein 3)